jgi:hypothetical protein
MMDSLPVSALYKQLIDSMAERVGFEPTLEFPLNTLSKRAPSTTRPSLHGVVVLTESTIRGGAVRGPSTTFNLGPRMLFEIVYFLSVAGL